MDGVHRPVYFLHLDLFNEEHMSETPPVWTGWIAVALFVSAAAIPLMHRLLLRRRAVPGSRPIRIHVLTGLATTVAAFGHVISILPSMGSPAAVAGGSVALLPGAFAFFLLFAHVGVGLRLRAPRLRERARHRRTHIALALTIAVAVLAHVLALRGGLTASKSPRETHAAGCDG